MPTDPDDALITRLLTLPADKRAQALRRACVEHPELRERLELLAQTLLDVVEPLQLPPAPASDEERRRALALAFETPECARAEVGPYTLLEVIGEGGFGVVWLAEQQTPIRRRVALKILKSSLDSREVISRFETERQALAVMDHPHIARVFDAGETSSGRPYFSMELVRGVAITRYCDENRLSVAQRLRLFVQVCQAVQHAHQKGIIHRDLKPSNIIVAAHDGLALPKVIDFGIAKATEPRPGERTLFTHVHAFIGTPAYTSPEQMELGGVDVDTRSDIYSLGALLYELLAGAPPFDPEVLLHSGFDAMRRTIREVDPPRPSLRLASAPEPKRDARGRARGSDAARLSAILRGDLDWIVMHCLEKDRARRYETAGDLAADVGHYLNNEPVAARPPSTRYRVGKLVRRNRLAFAAGFGVFLAIVGGLVISSALLLREQAARRRAVAAELTESRLRHEAEAGRERETALRQQADDNARQTRTAAATSEQVARFMKEMLAGVGPSAARGHDTTLLREVLDSTARRLDGELHDQPAVAADLRETLGLVYFDLGQYATAETLLRAAVAGRRSLVDADRAALATSLDKLGVVLSSLNEFAEAEAILREALALRRQLHGDEHVSVAESWHHLAAALARQGRTAESSPMAAEVLRLRKKLLGDEHPDVAASIASVGSHEESLVMRRRLLGNAHPAVADSLVGIGDAQPVGEQAKALAAYREAFEIRRKIFGDGHPQVTATLLRFLSALSYQSPLDEAAPIASEIIASTRKNLGNDAVALAPSLLALAGLLHGDAQHAAEANALVAEAHQLLEKSRTTGPSLDSETLFAMKEFAHGMVLSGQPERGLAMAAEMVTTTRSLFGPDHALTIDALRPLARSYYFSRRYAEARPLAKAAAEGMRRLHGPGHPMAMMLVALVAATDRKLGDFVAARTEIDAAIASFNESRHEGPAPDPAIATLLFELGLVLNHEKNFTEAERVFNDALGHHARARPHAVFPRFTPAAEIETGLALALAGQGRLTEAESLVARAFQALQDNPVLVGSARRDVLHDAGERVAQIRAAALHAASLHAGQAASPSDPSK